MRTTLWMFSLFCHLIFLSFDVCSTWFVCFFSYFVWLSLTGRRVTHSEHISHGMWTTECFIQSFTSWTSSSSFCLFLLQAAAARCFGDRDVYIAHKFLNSTTWHKREEGLCTAFWLNHHSKPCLQLKISSSSLQQRQIMVSKTWLQNEMKWILQAYILCCGMRSRINLFISQKKFRIVSII